MSQPPGDPYRSDPWPSSYQQANPTLSYQTDARYTRQYGSGPMLIKLHGIFTAVLAGLNGLATLCYLGMTVLMVIMLASSPRHSGDPPVFIAGIYAIFALPSLGAGIVQTIAAVKMLRKRRGAWGWGLAAAIVSCCSLWCSYFCVVPLAAGIFGIVALAQDSTRAYMATWNDNESVVDPYGSPRNPYGPA